MFASRVSELGDGVDRTGKRGRLIGVERVANVFDRAIPRRVVADPVAAHTGGESGVGRMRRVASGGCEMNGDAVVQSVRSGPSKQQR